MDLTDLGNISTIFATLNLQQVPREWITWKYNFYAANLFFQITYTNILIHISLLRIRTHNVEQNIGDIYNSIPKIFLFNIKSRILNRNALPFNYRNNKIIFKQARVRDLGSTI